MMRHLRLILTLAGRNLRELSRMPGVLAVIFVPGAVLYLVFTAVMPGGGGGSGGLPQLRLAVVDLDRSPASDRLSRTLAQMSVQVQTALSDGRPLDEAAAARLVEQGRVAAALIIPSGFSRRLFNFDAGGAPVDLIVDETQPMAQEMVAGMLQMAAGMAMLETASDLLAQLTGQPFFRLPAASAPPAGGAAAPTANGSEAAPRRLLAVRARGVALAHADEPPPRNLLYLVGLVPMFLLFNSSGAAGVVLEELRSGAARRILAAPVDAGDYLGGHLLSALVVSLLQVSSMYVLAWAVFKAPVFHFAGGLAVVTLLIAFATVGFGVLMASVARTSEQLQGIGTVVILGMSALGGSMFPRFFMPEWIRPFGLITINGWAYDGLLAIIRGQDLAGAREEMAVLLGVGFACSAAGALLLGRRLRTR